MRKLRLSNWPKFPQGQRTRNPEPSMEPEEGPGAYSIRVQGQTFQGHGQPGRLQPKAERIRVQGWTQWGARPEVSSFWEVHPLAARTQELVGPGWGLGSTRKSGNACRPVLCAVCSVGGSRAGPRWMLAQPRLSYDRARFHRGRHQGSGTWHSVRTGRRRAALELEQGACRASAFHMTSCDQ